MYTIRYAYPQSIPHSSRACVRDVRNNAGTSLPNGFLRLAARSFEIQHTSCASYALVSVSTILSEDIGEKSREPGGPRIGTTTRGADNNVTHLASNRLDYSAPLYSAPVHLSIDVLKIFEKQKFLKCILKQIKGKENI